MENKDFDNLFKGKLEGLNEDDFVFNDAAWQGVENTLNEKGILSPSKFDWQQYLPLLLLLLVASNGLVGWKFFQSNQKVHRLTTEVQTLESQLILHSEKNVIPNQNNDSNKNDNNLTLKKE